MKALFLRFHAGTAVTRHPLVLTVVVAFVLSGLATTGDPGSTVVPGPCEPAYGGEVCTWAEMSGGELVAMGATVPLKTIESAPHDLEMVWPPPSLASIKLPPVVREAAGFDHVMVNWEHHGHPPGPFMTPHFDFHFYTLTPEEVARIDCSDEGKPSKLPTGYALPDISIPELGDLVGLCVPNMGMHGLAEKDLAREDAFDATMVVGYYGGKPIFIEPMVSKAMLMEGKPFTIDVPRIGDVPAGIRYPTRFRADYDAGSRSYRLIFSGFDRAAAGP